MKTRRTILLILLIISLLLAVPLIIRPVNSSDQFNPLEITFLVFGIPIFLLNYLEWFAPDILNQMLGTAAASSSPEPDQTSRASQVGQALAKPGIQSFAVMAGTLVIGVALGVAALSMQAAPAPIVVTSQPTLTDLSTSVVEKPGIPEPTSSHVTTPVKVVPTQGGLFQLSPTPLAVNTLTNPGANATGTPDAQATQLNLYCTAPVQIQFDAIQTNIRAMNATYQIKKGYIVQSQDVTNLVFFGAVIYGPDFTNGVSDPGVWAFAGPLDAPTAIYAVNSIAQQFSSFDPGTNATPVVLDQATSAQIASNCAAAGN